ncbi:MAG: CDP-alcohol phosphatidyltransferase family protein [Gammaproteobacteria bacterium]|jgi:CDP-diacylglycerol--serine O-phosphatidyltransferase|nr:CDP-alcohol phosphatidyltransferase family protein [Gammaproteobacteria bacterium]
MSDRPTILSFIKDIPNIITLLGLGCGVLGIYFALLQNFPAAIIAMLWAILFDWYDGPAARRIPGRSEIQKSVGAKMDSLVDIVSLAICPATILLSYGEFSAWFFPGALAIVMAGVVRLAYFDVFGVDDDNTIAGLSLDITALVVALVFLLERALSHYSFSVILYITIVVLAILHVSPFRMHKMVGRWYHVITVYVLILTAIYSYILWVD